MLRTTTLLAVGLLLAGSTPALAQRQMTHAARSMHQQHPAAAPQSAQKPAVDSIKEPSPTGRTPADIKNVQTWLKELKLYDGPVSGVMGPDAEQALKKFQQAHQIPVTGRLSDTVMVLLRKATGQAPANGK
jgi:peptidoglycan hydrolase-like protein with peptidoglycan-binding domain